MLGAILIGLAQISAAPRLLVSFANQADVATTLVVSILSYHPSLRYCGRSGGSHPVVIDLDEGHIMAPCLRLGIFIPGCCNS